MSSIYPDLNLVLALSQAAPFKVSPEIFILLRLNFCLLVNNSGSNYIGFCIL